MIGLRASMFRFFVLAASDLLLVFEFSVYGLSLLLLLLLLLLLFPASPVFSPKIFAGGETYAPKAEMSVLLSLVSSASAAQTTAKDLWPARVSPEAEAKV